jgi:hypothetical protein
VHHGLPLSLSLCLLVAACSGHIEAVDTNHAEQTTGGSGGSGIVGAGGSTSGAGTGEGGGPNVTTSTTGSSGTTTTGTTGGGGQGGAGGPEAGTDPVDAGSDATNERGVGGRDDGAVGDAGPPPAIDYSIWQLQLPTGSGTSPTTIPPSQLATFSNIYFYKADDGGQIFMSPATGVTTQNSTRCRTELRESNPSGGAAAWSPVGTNYMTVSGKVSKGSGITIGQVFNGSDGITLAELQYSTSGFNLFYEEARGQGDNTNLGNRTALDTPYTFTMDFSKNVLTVTLNGKEVFRRTPSSGVSSGTFYFKAGNYDQTTSAGTPGTTAHSIVEAYSIAVVHQ